MFKNAARTPGKRQIVGSQERCFFHRSKQEYFEEREIQVKSTGHQGQWGA